MSEEEIVEYLLLQNRGAVESPMMRLFRPEIVASIIEHIHQQGYLRRLDMIPAMDVHPYAANSQRYIFSTAGRIRYYQLDRLLIAEAQKTDAGESKK